MVPALAAISEASSSFTTFPPLAAERLPITAAQSAEPTAATPRSWIARPQAAHSRTRLGRQLVPVVDPPASSTPPAQTRAAFPIKEPPSAGALVDSLSLTTPQPLERAVSATKAAQ